MEELKKCNMVIGNWMEEETNSYFKFAKETFGRSSFCVYDLFNKLIEFDNHLKKIDNWKWFIKSFVCKTNIESELLHDYFKSLNFTASDLSDCIINYRKFQNTKWMDYFKTLNPEFWVIRNIINSREIFKEYGSWADYLCDYYISLNPSTEDVRQLKFASLYVEKYINKKLGLNYISSCEPFKAQSIFETGYNASPFRRGNNI